MRQEQEMEVESDVHLKMSCCREEEMRRRSMKYLADHNRNFQTERGSSVALKLMVR